eukprot:6213745-Pleurochrysis_carterae.AAC.6
MEAGKGVAQPCTLLSRCVCPWTERVKRFDRRRRREGALRRAEPRGREQRRRALEEGLGQTHENGAGDLLVVAWHGSDEFISRIKWERNARADQASARHQEGSGCNTALQPKTISDVSV